MMAVSYWLLAVGSFFRDSEAGFQGYLGCSATGSRLPALSPESQ
jgi:hypothetical protein